MRIKNIIRNKIKLKNFGGKCYVQKNKNASYMA